MKIKYCKTNLRPWPKSFGYNKSRLGDFHRTRGTQAMTRAARTVIDENFCRHNDMTAIEQEKSIPDIIPDMPPTKFLIAALMIVPAIAGASDRSVAEWVLRVGGSLTVEGDRTPIWDISRLPARDFQIEAINLIDVLMQ